MLSDQRADSTAEVTGQVDGEVVEDSLVRSGVVGLCLELICAGVNQAGLSGVMPA